MLISVFTQLAIILLVCPAIWLIVRYDEWRETIGIGLGVIASPFIAYTALRHGQWGLLVPIVAFYFATFPALLTGIKNKFFNK